MRIAPITPILPLRNDASTNSDKRRKITLHDYCTTDPLQIETDSISTVITSTIGNSTYSTVVLNNGCRIGVLESRDYIENVLSFTKKK